MKIPGLDVEFAALSAPVPIWHARVTAPHWMAAAGLVRERGGRLLALWAGSPVAADAIESVASSSMATRASAVYVSYVLLEGVFWLALPLDAADGPPQYPDLSVVFPAAARMQRAAADLSGIHAEGSQDPRPWLNHGAWGIDHHPLLQDPQAVVLPAPGALVDYPFVRVEGDGVHEIAVGPVHAGIIEPGHFRFSVVGEKILRLEQRLGYTHKGIEQRMAQMAPLDAHRLAGRVSGDTTVGYAWAYCMALESATQTTIPPRAAWLRALLLERERVANHLGDLGALGNDAAFALALAQFSRLREDWLRNAKAAFGHRLMMDCITPGGVDVDLEPAQIAPMLRLCDTVEAEVRRLADIFEDHAGLQDRFLTTGRVTPALAAQLGLTGLAGRASSQAWDLRCDHPFVPYTDLRVAMAVQKNGDVAARVAVRFEEVFESLRMIRHMVTHLPVGPLRCDVVLGDQAALGAGWVEGWRGELFVALELSGADQGHRILRCHLHDPSWQNWPVLEHAVMGNIVADFPLINKSFNLSYSGQDL
ncbi:MAG: NADH-quinone oxidoreductase subunit C [Rhodoferax sp.]|nr:NADH-quinone oxidoreductase subunit C [Rhodoferax sp.]